MREKEIKLARQLISIPSFVDEKCNEGQMCTFILDYLRKLPCLKKIKIQKVGKDRFNILALDGHPSKLMFACHLDTVQPKKQSKINSFKGVIKGSRLYGLGAVDMKGGIAALLSALSEIKETSGLLLLFYVGEEYGFEGMKAFVEKPPVFFKEKSLRPELVIAPEPTNLEIVLGCRGCICLEFRIYGKTAHAANPSRGRNAILASTNLFEFLKKKLGGYSDKILGPTTCNLAYLQGGLFKGEDKQGKIVFGRQGNLVADCAEVKIEIRPSTERLRAKNIIKIIKRYLYKQGYRCGHFDIRADLGGMCISKNKVKTVLDVYKKYFGRIKFLTAGQFGYSDIQMLYEKFKINGMCLGPGPREKGHAADEYTNISHLKKLKDIYKEIILASTL